MEWLGQLKIGLGPIMEIIIFTLSHNDLNAWINVVLNVIGWLGIIAAVRYEILRQVKGHISFGQPHGLKLTLAIIFFFPAGGQYEEDVVKRSQKKTSSSRSYTRSELKLMEQSLLVGEYFFEEVLLAFASSMVWTLVLPYDFARALKVLCAVVLGYRIVSPIVTTIEAALHNAIPFRSTLLGRTSRSMSEILATVSKFIAWLFWFVCSAGLLGFDTSTMLTGIGVGGVSVGFALQSVLKDVFASITLVLEEWFDIGSKVTVGGKQGYVERVGLRSTKIRLVKDGEIMHIPNGMLTSSVVLNQSDMPMRRGELHMRIDSRTSEEQLRALIASVTTQVSKQDGVSQVSVNLVDISFDSGIDMEVIFKFNPGTNVAGFKQAKTYAIYSILGEMKRLGVQQGYHRGLLLSSAASEILPQK